MQDIGNLLSPQRKQVLCGIRRRKEIKQRLDELLENDLGALRRGEADDLLLKNHNVLILEYVKGIYDEYRIQNPLPDHLSRISFTPPGKRRARQKIQLMSTQTAKQSTPQRDHLSRSAQKENESFDFVGDESTVRKDHFQNNTTIRASLSYFELEHRDPHENTTLPLHSDNEQEGYSEVLRGREKQQLEMIVEDEVRPDSEDPQSSRNGGFTIPRQSTNSKPKEIPALPTETEERRLVHAYVQESFRYCIGCEASLLHVNIQSHESSCLQFQRVFQMPPDEIVSYLKEKVGAFDEQIQEQAAGLTAGDLACLQECSRRVVEESRTISSSGIFTAGFKWEYERAVQAGRNWALLAELINKVGWFLRIRQRLRSQFGL